MKHWSTSFVGTKFAIGGRSRDQFDCWGLVLQVYLTLDIEIPSYDGYSADETEKAELSALIARDASKFPWIRVLPGAEKEFDIIMISRGKMESHVGIVINQGNMIHTTFGTDCCIASYCNGRWARRVTGFYRHRALA